MFLKSKVFDKADIDAVIYEYHITDHFPVAIHLNLKTETQVKIDSAKIKKAFINFECLNAKLSEVNWQLLLDFENINQIATAFTGKIKSLLEENTYIKTIKKGNYFKKPWITKALLVSIKIKNNMFKKYKKDINNIALFEEYKAYRNRLTTLIRNSKIYYYKKLIDANKSDPKRLWKSIKIICGDNVSPQNKSNITKIKIQGDIKTDNLDIANGFNEHYANIGNNLAKSILNRHKNSAPEKNLPIIDQTIFLNPVSGREIIEEILKLKNNKSPGIDGITAETLKKIRHNIAEPLTLLANKCISTGHFPKIMKTGVIKPIYKSGNKSEPVNYRPITIITSFAKILEKVIKSRLNKFLDKFDLISTRQFGFRQNKSTQDAICFLISKIYKFVDHKRPCIAIFLDFSKAFDTVHHKTLLDKCYSIGIRGTALRLIESYLDQREQYVDINNTLSKSAQTKFGVPQGTVLGPLLFSIYVNDLLNLDSAGTILGFADDTVILYDSDTWNRLRDTISADLPQILNWLDNNLLTLNIDKTKYLPFSSYVSGLPIFKSIEIKYGNEEMLLTQSSEVKYLGIIIDSHLKWNRHISFVNGKIRSIIPKIKHLKQFLPQNTLKLVYYSLVQTHIYYGILGWGGINKHNIHPLTITQKWILKIIFNKPFRYPTDLLFQDSAVFNVRLLYAYAMCMELYKNKHSLLTFADHSYTTREIEARKARSDKTNKHIGQHVYTYLSTKVYNVIPGEIKLINYSSIIYKKKIKAWLKLSSVKNTLTRILD